MRPADLTPAALLVFGVLLGMRHAIEPDHLAAVSTLVARGRRRATASAFLGASWGLGHTLAILLLGGSLVLLRVELPGRAQAVLELGVSAMLVLLGARSMWLAGRLTLAHGHTHAPGDEGVHLNPGTPAHWHVGRFALVLRPLSIGLVHGLAGTGAIVSLVMPTLSTQLVALAYLASFGVGSILGMAGLTLAAEASLHRLQSTRALSILVFTTGLLSFGYGLYWGASEVMLRA